MKPLTIIQIILTALAFIALVVMFEVSGRAHHFAYSDPARQFAKQKADVLCIILQYAVLIPWILFTIYHVVIRGVRKSQSTKTQ